MKTVKLGSRFSSVGASAGTLGVVLLVSWISIGIASPENFDNGRSVTPDRELAIEGIAAEAGYPSSWHSTVGAVEQRLKFQLLVPQHPDANRDKITEAFLRPDFQAAALRFGVPQPEDAEIVRQPFIEIYYERWNGGDPAADYANDVALDPVIGKRVIDVNGYPALVVDAASPTDAEGANPAFLRFVVDGIEIQVSGGTDLQRIIDIAETLTP